MPSTPRSGIPYPAVGDPPNFPVQMDAIATAIDNMAKDDQGLLANKPISSPSVPGKMGRYYYATDSGVLYRDHGTGWSAVYASEIGTTMPGSAPVDYTQWTMLMPTEGAGFGHHAEESFINVEWAFRYVASEPTYKWVFVGGPPVIYTVKNSDILSTTSTTYAQLGDVIDPQLQIDLPRAGVYEIEFGANMWNSTNDTEVLASLSLLGAAASDNDAIRSNVVGVAGFPNTIAHQHCRRILQKTLATPGIVAFRYRVPGGTGNWRGQHLSIRPKAII